MWKPNEIDGEIAFWECSHCEFALTLTDGTPKENEFYYCPRCGRKNVIQSSKQMTKKNILKQIQSGRKCDKNCVVQKLYTHNTCMGCGAFKDSPYYKDEIKGKTDEQIANEIYNALKEA